MQISWEAGSGKREVGQIFVKPKVGPKPTYAVGNESKKQVHLIERSVRR